MPNDQVTIERLPKGRIKATVKFEEADYAPAEAEALKRFSERINIQGFRPGNAPADMVRAKVSPEDLFEETVRILLRGALPKIAEQEKIAPVIPPKVEVVSRIPVTLAITFVEKPEVTVKNIESLSIEKKKAAADPKDIERVIESVLQEHRTLTEIERPAATGDQVTIDFHATDDAGQKIPGMEAAGYNAVLGSKSLLPGFEEELAGLGKGGTKSFPLTLPEKFQVAELQGKKATFHVTVQKVEEVKMPELTDEFAKEKLRSDNVAAFKKMVEDSITMQEEQFIRMNRERLLMDEIRKRTDVDIADELIEEEVRGMIEEWAGQLERQGKTIAQALEEQKKKPEDVEKEMRVQALDRWKLRLGIAKLIEHKQITVTDDELKDAFEQFLANVPSEQKSGAQGEWDKRGALYDEVRWRSMVDKLIDTLLN